MILLPILKHMTLITMHENSLDINILGLDKIWALKSVIHIPKEHITGVENAQDKASKWFMGIKIGATHIPGVFSAGTFYTKEGLSFWDVLHPKNAIVIYLKDERYKEVIVEVENPNEEISKLKNLIQ